MAEPIPLNTHILYNKFLYIVEQSDDHGYIYAQYDEEGKLIAYEVFKYIVRKSKEVKFPNGIVRQYPDRVRFPRNEDFGIKAWSYAVFNNPKKAFEAAREKYDQIRDNARKNKEANGPSTNRGF